ncbi:probable cytochrome P450 313a4 [Scaptodrosophila lebanonensis]|uniref:Probable cytochrome P450 313a4 n=1 Tax=Drosophila lebanonensis TaxID=7225 RepID=A0A6J2T603_DROLE|nr:probable cytochrome P450 313a4 [Scaptodrosophila lebanonensis]
MFSLSFWITILLCLWIYLLWTRRKFYLLTLKFPGPFGYPIIGMAHKLLHREDVLSEFGYYIKQYGPTLFSWLGPIPFLIVSDPQLTQDILTSPHCVNKGLIYKAVDDGAGKGLFSQSDPTWSIHRKLLNPAFGHKVLLSFLPVFNSETAALLNVLKGMENEEKDFTQVLQSFTLRIATQTTMGSDVKDEECFKNNILLQRYQCVQETMTDMCFSPWLNNRILRIIFGKEESYSRAKLEIRAFIKKLIVRKLNEDSANTALPKDKNIFLNLATDLLKRGIFSWKNVEDESNVIVFGAFETTANTLYYSLMLLAMFPDYQEKAFEEIKTIFPNPGDFEVSYADTKQMIYMDMILNESMRVMSPVPLVSRQTSQDLKLSNGVTIPKGIQIALDIFHMHRSKSIWGPEAETFNPDNFLPTNLEDKHPYAYIPFTKGIRNCIGWRYALISAKVTLAKLLRNFKFTTSFPFEDLVFVEDITIKLEKAPLLKLQRRN